jgi:hypothetical protein
MPLFDYFNKHPNELELFAEAMRRFSVATGTAVLHAAGFQLTRVVSTSSFAHVVEAIRIK